MNSLSSISLSGMNAAQLHLGAAAHNIANAQTPEFRRSTVTSEAQAGGGVTASVGRSSEIGENLAEDIVQTMVAAYSFKANLKVLQTQYSLLGSLLDLSA